MSFPFVIFREVSGRAGGSCFRSGGVTGGEGSGASFRVVARMERGGGVGIAVTISLENSTMLDVASTGICGGGGARFLRIDLGWGGDVGGGGLDAAVVTCSTGFRCGGGDGELADDSEPVVLDLSESGGVELRSFTRSNITPSSCGLFSAGSRLGRGDDVSGLAEMLDRSEPGLIGLRAFTRSKMASNES